MPIQPVLENREQVVSTIRQVATMQNADFRYLLNQARVESGLNPRAKAATSSASGLFQFTAGTWLEMVKRHGDKVGLVSEAQALRANPVSSVDRSQILELRNEPQVATSLAAYYAADNGRALLAAGHKTVGPTELYLAHFLGSSGATTFLNGLRDNPSGPAANALPAAASSNSAVFFKDRIPRSYQEIYNRFAEKFGGASVADGVSPVINDLSSTANGGEGISESRLKQIVASALSSRAHQPPDGTIDSSSSLNVSEETLSKYLKNFSLADHASGMAQVNEFRPRDASKGASSNVTTSPLDEQSISPLAAGARMMLRAVDQEPRDNGLQPRTR